MYIPPKSFLSRLLGAAWTILLIALLLWVAAQLLADVWIWIVIIGVIGTLVWVGIRIRRLRRESW